MCTPGTVSGFTSSNPEKDAHYCVSGMVIWYRCCLPYISRFPTFLSTDWGCYITVFTNEMGLFSTAWPRSSSACSLLDGGTTGLCSYCGELHSMGFLTPTGPTAAYFADQKSNHWSPMRTLHHFQDSQKNPKTQQTGGALTSWNVLCCVFLGGSSS